MSVEQIEKTFLGVRLEDPKIDNLAFKTSLVGAELTAVLRRTEVDGSLPQYGPGLVIANHPDWTSIFVLAWSAVHTAHRSMRLVARDTLINPQIKEDERVLKRTGKDDFLNKDSDRLTYGLRTTFGKYLTAIGNPILIHRGSPKRETFQEIQQELINDHLVGMFLQETRTPEWDLRNAMDGPALIAKNNPNTPVYVVAMSHVGLGRSPKTWFHPKVSVDTPFTFNGIKPKERLSDRDERKYVTTHIVNRIAAMLQKQLPENQPILLPNT